MNQVFRHGAVAINAANPVAAFQMAETSTQGNEDLSSPACEFIAMQELTVNQQASEAVLDQRAGISDAC